jgi:CBS domain-containing protein
MKGERSAAARDIMTTDPVTVTPDLSVTDAARIMVENRVGALPVLDAGKLVGIVTEGDLISQDLQLEYPTYIHLLDGMVMYPPVSAHVKDKLERAAAATVRDVMTDHPFTVSPDATVEDVAELMIERGVGRLLVTAGEQLVGVVSKSDIVRSLIAE